MVLRFLTLFFAAAQPAPGDPAEPLTPRIVRDCEREAREARARGGEIVVCGDRGARSPYRLPEQPQRFDPAGPIDSVSRERHRMYEVGEGGIGSCSTVGPGGWTGCMPKRWKDAREQWGK